MALSPFTWGGNTGQKLTPRQVEQRRVQNALMQREATQTTPVAHWSAGLNRALQGFLSGREDRTLRDAEQAGIEGARLSIAGSGLLGGSSPVAAALGGQAAPMGADAEVIRQGLLARGLPEHIADGFLMNFQDESGLNPGINEASPLVPGSRGGFGLAQWTGPRRRELEAFAAQRGVPPSDLDAQLDFLMGELQGTENSAWQQIMGAQDAGQAGAAIVNSFLRPAEEHRSRRAQQYLGGGGQISPIVQDMAQGPSSQALISAMSDPWVAQEYGPVLQALAGQAAQRENAIFEQQLAQQDPMYAARLQRAQLENQALMNPAAPAPVFQGGQWWSAPQAGQVPQALTQAAPDQTAAMQNYQYLIENGVTPQEAMARAFSGGVTVNTGDQGQRIGSIPAGFASVEDPTNPSGFRFEAIPGGPAAAAAEAAAGFEENQRELGRRAGAVVMEDIDRAIEQATGGLTTGMLGSWLSSVPGTPAYDLQNTLRTIRSNIGFDRLQQMREASPTGGALGSVSERELTELQSVMGSLEQGQSDQQLLHNLNRFKKIYGGIMEKFNAYPGQAGASGASGSVSRFVDAAISDLMAVDIMALSSEELDAWEARAKEVGLGR